MMAYACIAVKCLRWFEQRRAEGVAEFRNAFGGAGKASLRDEDVLGYLFWTQYARPFGQQFQHLRDDGIPYVFQYTITGYGGRVEPYIPRLERVVNDFLTIRAGLPSSEAIQWRNDPIVLSEEYPLAFHLERFAWLAEQLQGATAVVNISFVEPYAKTIRRMADESVRYRALDAQRHKSIAARYPDLPQIDNEARSFLDELSAIARERSMELRSCRNPEWELPPSQCCGAELFAPYGEQFLQRVSALQPAPSRLSCRCLKSVDIGTDNTCLGGCRYCYVVQSHQRAIENYKKHDPAATSLR